MAIEHTVFSGWAHITRAEDLPDCWVAYCPDFDVMSTGRTPQHALAMIREAVALAIQADLNEGCDPMQRRASNDEDWAPLHALFERHTKVSVSDMDSAAMKFTEFAAPLALTFVRADHVGVTAGKAPLLSDVIASAA